MVKESILRVEGITKLFASTRALVDVTIDFHKGEIRGLIGENGSGKSTLANVISGQLHPDAGSMVLHGEKYKPSNNIDARNHKICMIIQEMGTIDNLTVAANIFLGKENLFRKNGFINVNLMNKEAARILKEIDAEFIQPNVLVNKMSFEDRKIVEMARSMYLDPDILIVDETTTALSQNGRELLYKIIAKMKAQNKTVIFISHDLEEVMSKCDTISVMRDGTYIDTLEVGACTPSQIKQLMVGREIGDMYYRNDYEHTCSEKVALECKDISIGILNNVTLQLHKGEILGVAGLTDSGIHEIGKVLFGLITPATGSVHAYKENKAVEIKKPIAAIHAKVGYVSKNRDQEALMLLASIKENIALP
ncbi:MAG: ATP-binding cassette domain-containing protein [Oscillospiraceae bacterium]